MKRPEKELMTADLPRGMKPTRRLLAYLLRATKKRIRKEKIGESRYYSLASELEGALVPLVVSERSALGFYKALCARFSVDASDDTEGWGPIEAWMPEGRVRWDRALAAMDYADMRVVIHENPALFATFACERQEIEGEDAMFEALPDPVRAGGYKPKLPSRLIAPKSFRTVWTLTSPMHHGADEKHGNVNLFRRHRTHDPLTGTVAYVMFMAGNAVRGLIRDMVMGRYLQLLGLKSEDIPPARAHAMLAGGAVEQGADTGKVNNPVRRRARDLCPPWDLLAGCTDQQIMAGRARIGDAMLVCRENAWIVHEAVAPDVPLDEFAASLPVAAEMTQLRLGTRHTHRELEDSDGVQMLFNTELLMSGYQMVHTFQLFGIDGVDPVTASCMNDFLRDFCDVGVVGAGAARGLGLIAFDPYQPGPGTPELPSPDLYLEKIEQRKQEMIDWCMMIGEPPAPEGGSKKGRGKKGKHGEVSADAQQDGSLF